MSPPRIICLTPIKNEEWILERFLRSASLWADHIIVADQGSSDRSRAIAEQFPKVILIENRSPSAHEGERQRLLIDAARTLPSPRLLIALDADEFLTPNFTASAEWNAISTVKPGTVINFFWANIRPDVKHYWTPPEKRSFGFMDDGSDFAGVTIHSTRIPYPPHAGTMTLHDVLVMHFQYVDWARMESKHRWYQCFEHQMFPEKSAVNIYRQYHHMDAIGAGELKDIPEWWFDDYAQMGIDLRTIVREAHYWWDGEILRLFTDHGTKKFSQLAIWNVDWTSISQGISPANPMVIRDPRNLLERIFHLYASMTQSSAGTGPVVFIDKVFRRILRLMARSKERSA